MSFDAVGFSPGKTLLSALPSGSPSRGKALAAQSMMQLDAAKANQKSSMQDMANENQKKQAKAGNSAKASQNAIAMQGKQAQIGHQGQMSKIKMDNMKQDNKQQKYNQKQGMFLEGLIKT